MWVSRARRPPAARHRPPDGMRHAYRNQADCNATHSARPHPRRTEHPNACAGSGKTEVVSQRVATPWAEGTAPSQIVRVNARGQAGHVPPQPRERLPHPAEEVASGLQRRQHQVPARLSALVYSVRRRRPAVPGRPSLGLRTGDSPRSGEDVAADGVTGTYRWQTLDGSGTHLGRAAGHATP